MTDACTPEHCAESDVVMIDRRHSPSHCPAQQTAPARGATTDAT